MYVFTCIVEKPWSLSAAMMELFLKKALLESARRQIMIWWSDVGPHFRAYCLLCWVATKLMQLSKLDHIWNFGPESHFEKEVD